MAWKPKPSEADRRKAIIGNAAKMIEHGLVDNDIPNKIELARLMGLSKNTLYSKMHRGTWTLEDLIKICTILRFDQEAAAKLLGVGCKY